MTKHIIVASVWVLMIVFSAVALAQSYIPSSYARTTYTVINSINVPSSRGLNYKINALFTANNGKAYSINFESNTTTGIYPYYVYYDRSNPAVNKRGGDPIVVDLIPIAVAALVTFLVYSNITFTPKNKKKKNKAPAKK